jgi:hypothetical protein
MPYEHIINLPVGLRFAALAPFHLRRDIMVTNNTGDWRDLFDVALFEPNRARSRQCIEHAKHAINNRLDVLTKGCQSENGRIISERIALSDALTTLAELQKIVYARKPSPSLRRQDNKTASQADL